MPRHDYLQGQRDEQERLRKRAVEAEARALKAEADAERSKQLYYRSDDRAAKAEAERDMLVAGIKNNIEHQRALAAEAALRDIANKASDPFDGNHEAALMACGIIARAALEGK
jgi:hypothetical protein